MKKFLKLTLLTLIFLNLNNLANATSVPVPISNIQYKNKQTTSQQTLNAQTSNSYNFTEKPKLTPKPIPITTESNSQITTQEQQKTNTVIPKTSQQEKTIFNKEQTKVQEISQTIETIKPSELNELREQAKFLYNSNKLDDAKSIFNKIAENDKISDDWLFLANISQDKGDLIDAVFYLKKAIELDEQNYKAHYNLGNLYYEDNKTNMALSQYRKVLKIKKDYAYAHYNKGCCYLKNNSYHNAKYEFGLAIKANPNEASFYYNLAYTYKMLNKPKKAQEALNMYNKLMTE